MVVVNECNQLPDRLMDTGTRLLCAILRPRLVDLPWHDAVGDVLRPGCLEMPLKHCQGL
jgi:hypothetical protein